jgi:glutamate-ammonia-ligase adenylyltransferase
MRAQHCGLLPAPVGENAAQAYRSLRQIQHKARLNEEPTQVDESDVKTQSATGLALWNTVFHKPE